MTTKLTLSLEKSIIEKAKVYAAQTGRSLSELIETYLDNLTKSSAPDEISLVSELRELYGAAKIPKNLDHKKEIRKILSNKHK